MSTITDLKTQIHSVLRRNKYKVVLTPPMSIGIDNKLSLLCKGAEFPEKNIGAVEVSHMGRKYYLRGETTYNPTTTLTFYDDDNLNIRRFFDYWMNIIDDSRKTQDRKLSNVLVKSAFRTDLEVWQLDHNQNNVYGYTYHDSFPISAGTITYAGDEEASAVEFTVTFQYSEFSPIATVTE